MEKWSDETLQIPSRGLKPPPHPTPPPSLLSVWGVETIFPGDSVPTPSESFGSAPPTASDFLEGREHIIWGHLAQRSVCLNLHHSCHSATTLSADRAVVMGTYPRLNTHGVEAVLTRESRHGSVRVLERFQTHRARGIESHMPVAGHLRLMRREHVLTAFLQTSWCETHRIYRKRE